MHELHGGELHVATAWELYGEATMRSSAFASAPPELIETYLRTEHDDRLQAIKDPDCLISRAGGSVADPSR